MCDTLIIPLGRCQTQAASEPLFFPNGAILSQTIHNTPWRFGFVFVFNRYKLINYLGQSLWSLPAAGLRWKILAVLGSPVPSQHAVQPCPSAGHFSIMCPAVASSFEISHQAPLRTQSSVGFVEFPQEALHLRMWAQSRLSRYPRASVMPVICAPFKGGPQGKPLLSSWESGWCVL